MDLQNNRIKMSRLIKTPEAKEIIIREFPELNNPLMIMLAKRMTLDEVLEFARGRAPEEKVRRTLEELERL